MSSMFQGSNCTMFSDILRHLESLHLTKLAQIPNLLTIVHLILINPATSCAPLRDPFQSLEELKYGFVKQWRLFNNLSILPIHKELTDSINLVDIGNEFASKYDGCKIDLGRFVPSDLL